MVRLIGARAPDRAAKVIEVITQAREVLGDHFKILAQGIPVRHFGVIRGHLFLLSGRL
jgi:hypothetical protein